MNSHECVYQVVCLPFSIEYDESRLVVDNEVIVNIVRLSFDTCLAFIDYADGRSSKTKRARHTDHVQDVYVDIKVLEIERSIGNDMMFT
jgi:hypothetical protein